VGAVLGISSWLCMAGVSKFSTADIPFIVERYFYLILIVIGSAIILNKNSQSFSEIVHLNVNVFHYYFMGFV
jgi:hypothetical protein